MPDLDAKRKTQNAKRGFSLIELLIVISLFGVAASLITVAYLGFERNQRLKNAATTLKSDIRLVQSKAESGDKSGGGACTTSSSSYTLIGWYIFINKNATSYDISRVCSENSSGNQTSYPLKTVSLPYSVIISKITYEVERPAVNILFRPLNYNVSFHNMTAPPFTDSSGNLTNLLAVAGSPDELIVDLQVGGSSNIYEVVIKSTGEVNEVKP